MIGPAGRPARHARYRIGESGAGTAQPTAHFTFRADRRRRAPLRRAAAVRDTLPPMPDRRACERRVYRLATLLTGHPVSATRVVESVVDAQPDLARIDSVHLDRLTVLRSREIPSGRLTDDRVSGLAADALAALTTQQRDAWVFVRVYGLPVREAARAMDCSATAARQHLKLADAVTADRLDGRLAPQDAAEQLRAYSMALDVPQFFRRQRVRRRRVRMILIIAAALLAAAGALWIALRV